MKTEKTIKSDISFINYQFTKGRINGKAQKKAIQIMNTCLFYVETNPNKNYVEKMLNDAISKKKGIDAGFSEWYENFGEKYKRPNTVYRKIRGTLLVEAQIRTLKYILDPQSLKVKDTIKRNNEKIKKANRERS